MFEDIGSGHYSFNGIEEDERYVVFIDGDNAQLWMNGKKNHRVTKKIHIQKMLTLPMYKDFKKIKR